MTRREAEAEAVRRWGAGGTIRERGGPQGKGRASPGRLARYRYIVGNGRLSHTCSILGQGDSWRSAFEDAGPRISRGRLDVA
jgi:hypothetical protein